jgi:hypothetical protein
MGRKGTAIASVELGVDDRREEAKPHQLGLKQRPLRDARLWARPFCSVCVAQTMTEQRTLH